ncbi:MAG TPA: hypothetical protein VN231_07395, partial [Allosphingosinicella sp.]|nr:hypothetical protein [Allosphingosinicella sp.]
ILSLAISGATFLLNRTEAHRSSVAAENRAAYAAYELGKRLALSFVVYHQVDQGTPAAIAAARQEALYKAREAQPYANGLGVEFSIAELIAQYRPGQSVFNESVIDAVAIRLRASHPEPVVEKFRLGFAFFWLMFNIGAAEQANRDFLPRLAEGYPAIAADINRQLGDMGVQERLPPTLADPAAVFQLAPRIRREMEAVLDAARRS